MAITGAGGGSSTTPDMVSLSNVDVGTPIGSSGPPPGATSAGKGGSLQIADQAIQQETIAQNELDFPNLKIKGILGGLPVAERNQEYFAVFEEAGDTAPELIGQTQFKVTYLCDSLLNVDKPSDGNIALLNINQNFERQKFGIVRADQGTALNPQLVGTHQITAVGTLAPIGGTQIGQGPLDYVTTMSFQQEGQLGLPAGLPIAEYYMWMNKTPGFQNSLLSYENPVPLPYNMGSADLGTTASNEDNPLRTYFDSQQIITGSGTQAETVGSFFTNDYIDTIKILTSSIAGNNRLKITAGIGMNIATSSVADLVSSFVYPPSLELINYYSTITLNVYKSGSSNGKELIATKQKSINTFNPSLTGDFGSIVAEELAPLYGGNFNLELFANGFPDQIPNFSWSPNQSVFIEAVSDYIDVNKDDTIFAELVLPEESSTGSIPDAYFSASADQNLFWQSLHTHKNEAAITTYQYFGGHLISSNETAPGNLFVQGVTGLTASYQDENGNSSIYNYTSSYWAGFNNTTGSEGNNISYLTSSTALALFYGSDYYQVNPGTETYNTHNLSSLPSSSLTITQAGESIKKTWINFGGNSMRYSFTPIPGDFIRFEYNPNKVFQILNVSSVGNVFKLELDNHISPSTIIDNFLIYRIDENGQYIIMDIEKDVEAGITQAFRGIIQPIFPSENQIENQDSLIFKLKEAGIIEDSAPINISGVN